MELEVISLNIWEGAFLEQAIEFFKAENPDVLLLQEAYGENGEVSEDRFRAFEVLKERLGFAHGDFVPGLRHRRPEGKFLQGNAILSKLPITKSDAVFYNDPFNDDFVDSPETNQNFPHTLQHVELNTPVGAVHVFNLHGTWDLDGGNYSEKRQQMSRAIIDGVAGKTHVILAGDTNAKPTNQAITEVENHLHSVFGRELKTTFNMAHKDNPGYATAAVDMMFVSPDVQILEKACPNVDISDHLPLVVRLKI